MAYESHSDYARIYADLGTGVWLAPKGTTLPTTLTTDPEAPFKAVGWLSADTGITLSVDKDVKEFNALQGGSLIRRKVGKVTQKFKFACLEETAQVLQLVFADQAVTVTTGVAKINIAANQTKTVERSMVIDAFDGAVQKRIAVSAADITFTGEIPLATAEDLTVYEFEATILAGAEAYMLTNSPGVIVTP